MVSLFFVSFFCQKKGGKKLCTPALLFLPKTLLATYPSMEPSQTHIPSNLFLLSSIQNVLLLLLAQPPIDSKQRFFPFPFPSCKEEEGRRRKPPFSLPILNTPVPSSFSIPLPFWVQWPTIPIPIPTREGKGGRIRYLFLSPYYFRFPHIPPTYNGLFIPPPTFFLFFLENREMLHPPYFRTKKPAFSFKIARYKKVSLFHNPLDVGIITLSPSGLYGILYTTQFPIFSFNYPTRGERKAGNPF